MSDFRYPYHRIKSICPFADRIGAGDPIRSALASTTNTNELQKSRQC